MKKDKPLVSIVTPSYNQGRFIEDTLLSVKNQDYPNIEHIVVDGGSTDNTLEILRKYESKYNLKWISEPDEGQSDAVNKGFKMSKGEIIGWLNSDDVYFYKNVISYVVAQFKKFSNADIVYGNIAFINENNYIFRVQRFFDWDYNRLLKGFSPPQPATFFREKVILENRLDKNLNFAMDLEFWLRLGKNHNFKHVKKVLAGDRIRKGMKRNSHYNLVKEEDKRVRREYGWQPSLKYFLYRRIYLPHRTIKRLVGVIDILWMQKNPDNLAFNGKYRSKHALIVSQIYPLFSAKRNIRD